MKIETKYSIDDTVFFMKDNHVESFVVKSINVGITDYYDNNMAKQIESYSADIYGRGDFILGLLLFKDVDLLFNSLKSKIKKDGKN